MPSPILIHQKSAHAEGSFQFGLLTMGALLLGIVQAFLMPVFWANSKIEIVAGLGIEAVILGVCGRLAYLNWRSHGTFVCRLDAREIRCHFPVPAFGEDFVLPLKSITQIVRRASDEGGLPTWILCGLQERRYELPWQYENPADEFIEAIQKLRPDLKVVEEKA
jgi:hypothetical protein